MMPCLTTPDENGRPPPQGAQASDPAWSRWKKDGQRFAPWHYEECHMVKVKDKLQLPPPELKEEMHQLPVGYTAGKSDHIRHKMLGNGWHVGCARAIIFLALISGQAELGQSIPCNPHPFGASKMEIMANRWIAAGIPWGPATAGINRLIPETSDLQWHFQKAMSAKPPTLKKVDMDPMLAWCYEQAKDMGPTLLTWRVDIEAEIRQIIEDNTTITFEWWQQRKPHIQKAYKNPLTDKITQIPVMLDIMRLINVPGIDKWESHLQEGFNMLGHLDPGPGWKSRTDMKLSDPWDMLTLRGHNKDYIAKKVRQGRVDEHWSKMLDEILADCKLLRMEGPFQAPADAIFQTVGLPPEYQRDMLNEVPIDIIIAWAFAILQIGSDGLDKLRRGEDWRRGGQNATTHALDQPHHHTPDHYVTAGDKVHQLWPEGKINLWGHDHDGAYRQLPLDNPAMAFVILMTPFGPTLWTHNVLMFGAVASVWAYNKLGDILTAIARILMLIPAMHYVDDYGAVEIDKLADSSFRHFKSLNELLGWVMKPSKAQEPRDKHKMQGVFIHFQDNKVIISPCKKRVKKLLAWMAKIRHKKKLPAEEAKTLAGKTGFVATSMFGRVGRCAMRAIWMRAASNDSSDQADTMTPAIEDSLKNLMTILLTCPPRTIDLNYTGKTAIIYTDAFFTLGEQTVKVGKGREIPDKWQVKDVTSNGWGFVVIPDQSHPEIGFVMHGVVPLKIVNLFSGTKAFIYFLEALAAIFAPMMLRRVLPQHYISFVDNEAAKFALLKGYGKQVRVNHLIATFWNFNAANLMSPWVERVSSGANWADSVSRNDFSLAREKGWIRLRPVLNYIWPILHKIAIDADYAHGKGQEVLAEALQATVAAQLSARGFIKPVGTK